MKSPRFVSRLRPAARVLLALLVTAAWLFPVPPAGAEDTAEEAPWWKPEWPLRKQLVIDLGKEGVPLTDEVGDAPVLVRLHEGNFSFLSAREDGSDIRFVAADGETVLSHHLEKFDGLLNEAFVWVKVPGIKPGEKTTVWLYYGNAQAAKEESAPDSYPAAQQVVLHFGEASGTPADVSKDPVQIEGAGVPLGGALIGGGLRLTGQTAITLQPAPAWEWGAGAPLTWSAWIKPLVLQNDAVLFSRREEGSGFLIGENQGVSYVEVISGGAKQRSSDGPPIAANVWRHLAVVAGSGKITLYLDGQFYSELNAPLPALKGPAVLGKDSAGSAAGFSGELDELQIAGAAQPASWLRLSAVNQGTSGEAGKLLVIGEDEVSGQKKGHGSEALEHVMLFGDIARNMMFDGWIAIGVCVLMIATGWTVAVRKFLYLNTIQKGSELFLAKWKQLSSDLTALDHDNPDSIKTLGGVADGRALRDLRRSPIYHLYHIGAEEIRHRVSGAQNRARGLSARSIQAIRAALDSGLVHENHRMNKGLIFLTISIAGGPYVGLLGTVVGVMITFAIIAKSGEVDVNSIAPGIASALLATVAGLIVAIPALFMYSYLRSRIKDLLSSMQVFIDEFISKMAEFYPTPADLPGYALNGNGAPAAVRGEAPAAGNEPQTPIRGHAS